MTKQYWDSLTEEERLKLFEELEKNKDVKHRALEQFVKNKSKQSDDEKWVSIQGLHECDFALRVSDINYIETNEDDITQIHTKIIHNGKNKIFFSSENPSSIISKIK